MLHLIPCILRSWLKLARYCKEPLLKRKLLIKTCFFKQRKVQFQYKKQLIRASQYKEVNCTDPSPSVRIPFRMHPQNNLLTAVND
jgi:hypothetical protein